MKKSLRKLALRTETIRALAGRDMARVIGGQDIDTADAGRVTKDLACPAPNAVQPGK